MKLTPSTVAWAKGLWAAGITAFSTAAVGVFALPTVFNLSKDGILNICKITLAPAAISVFRYLQRSPLPGMTVADLQPGDTAKLSGVVATSEGITATSATIAKAPASVAAPTQNSQFP